MVSGCANLEPHNLMVGMCAKLKGVVFSTPPLGDDDASGVRVNPKPKPCSVSWRRVPDQTSPYRALQR